jgi:hypothetical protein
MKVFKVRIARDGSEKCDSVVVRAETAVEACRVADATLNITESGWEVIDAKEVRPKKVANG